MHRWVALDPPHGGVGAAQVLLVAAAFLMPVVIMRGKSATSDETAHLPAGYSYLLRASSSSTRCTRRS